MYFDSQFLLYAVFVTVSLTYSVTVTDANGCSATATATVAGSVSIEEFTNAPSNINVYPNPTNGIFTLEVSSTSYQTLVRNIVGQVIESRTANSNVTTFDLSNYEKGIYFLTVIEGTMESTTRVVVK